MTDLALKALELLTERLDSAETLAELVAAEGIELTELVVGLVNRPAASSPQTG